MTTTETLDAIGKLIVIANDHPEIDSHSLAFIRAIICPGLPVHSASEPPEPTIREMELLRTQGKIPAIRAHRARTSLGLKESKDLVENAGLRLGILVPTRNGMLMTPADAKKWEQQQKSELEPDDPVQTRYIIVRNGKVFTKDGVPHLFEDRTSARLAANIFCPDAYDAGEDDPEYQAKYAAEAAPIPDEPHEPDHSVIAELMERWGSLADADIAREVAGVSSEVAGKAEPTEEFVP
jgi:hypothetical protein